MDNVHPIADAKRASTKKTRQAPPTETEWDNLKAEQVVAEKFVARCGDRIRYVPGSDGGGWYAWDEKRWAPDDGGAAVSMILQAYVKDMILQAIDDRAPAEWLKFAISCGNERRQRAILALAHARNPVVTKQDAFDGHRFLLNAKNGTIDLRTGEIRAHDRDDLLTQMCPVKYNPQAACPRWELFLSQVLVEKDGKTADQNLIDFVHRAIGYSLTGDPCEDAVFFLHGGGQNGKSTMLKVLKDVLGDYGCAAKTETFTKTRDDGPKYDFAKLYKKRFVVAMEVASNKRLAESVVKGASGGDSMVADRKYRDSIEFDPEFSLWFGVNHIPKIDDTDDGIWRRIRLIPFYASFAAGTQEREEHLSDTLAAESEGILAWAVRGCLSYFAKGLGHATAVDDATSTLRSEMDTFQAFIDDCLCLKDKTAKTATARIRKAYIEWAAANGATSLSTHAITKILDSKRFERTKGNGSGRCFIGIAIAESGTLFDEQDTSEANSGKSPIDLLGKVSENTSKVSFSGKSVPIPGERISLTCVSNGVPSPPTSKRSLSPTGALCGGCRKVGRLWSDTGVCFMCDRARACK